MESSTVAQPPDTVAVLLPPEPGLKHRSLWAMVVLTVVTLGFYYSLWFLRRRTALNRLDSATKVSLWPPLLTAALFVVQVVLEVMAGVTGEENVLGPMGSGLELILRLTGGIALIIQCFRIRDIIQDHATPGATPDQQFVERVELSGLMTFFFSIFYLQWAINKYIVARPSPVRTT